MKSTWFGDRSRYDFARCIHDAAYNRHHWDNMQSFLRITEGAFRQACHKFRTGRMDEQLEAEVVKEQNRYGEKGTAKFSEALGILTTALEKEPLDFIGTTMMELELLDSKYKGQCFTPKEVSRMMAEMTLADAKPDSNRTLMLSEPACGGGSMIIQATEVLKNKGFFPWHLRWHAVDVDWKCYAMTYIQTTLLAIPCDVICGNSLTLEVYNSATNLFGLMYEVRREDECEICTTETIEPAKPALTTVPPVESQQMELF